MEKYIEANRPLGIGLPNLVDYPIKKSIGWTISIPERHFVPLKEIKPKPDTCYVKGMTYRQMSPETQWNWIKNYYCPDLLRYCKLGQFHMFPEVNKKGYVHAHLVIRSEDPKWDVFVFIAKCKHHVNCVNVHGGKNMSKLNFIHTIKELPLQWVDYIQKDYYTHPLNFVSSP